MSRYYRKEYIWSLYSGDEFIDVGTIKELSERNRLTIKKLIRLSSPEGRQKKDSKLSVDIVCRIDELEKESEEC